MSEKTIKYGNETKELKFEDLGIDFQRLFGDHYSAENVDVLLKRIWDILTIANLTRYGSVVEKTAIYIRLLAVIGLLNDFIVIAWNEVADNNYYYWYTELSLPKFPLVELHNSSLFHKTYKDDDEYFEEKLNDLICDERRILPEILKKGFGGESDFFLELWKGTCPFLSKDSENENIILYDGEEEDDILDNLKSVKLGAFSWVREGCEVSKNY